MKRAEYLHVIGVAAWIVGAAMLPFNLASGEPVRPEFVLFLVFATGCIAGWAYSERSLQLVAVAAAEAFSIGGSFGCVIVLLAARDSGWHLLGGRLGLLGSAALIMSIASFVFLRHVRRHGAQLGAQPEVPAKPGTPVS